MFLVIYGDVFSDLYIVIFSPCEPLKLPWLIG